MHKILGGNLILPWICITLWVFNFDVHEWIYICI
ncbi:Odorant receptor 146, partial [Halyomorpha halys]